MASALQGSHVGEDRLVLPPPPTPAEGTNDDQDGVNNFKVDASPLKLRIGSVAAAQSPISVLDVLGSPTVLLALKWS